MHSFHMTRRARAGFAAFALMAAVSLGACADKTTVNTSPADTSGITVTGRGEVQIPPDIGFVTVGIQSTAATVAEARDQAATAATAVIDALKAQDIEAADIQTVGLSISPVYEYRTNENPRITGYMVTNTVVAKVRDLETMSAVIDEAVVAGGDDSRLQGISFGIDDETEAKEQAREAAMADAKAKAEQLARLGEVTLGAPVTISEGSIIISDGAREQADSIAGSGVATPIEVGTNTVTVDVSVRYAVE
jgi:uncharacterized protein YggE